MNSARTLFSTQAEGGGDCKGLPHARLLPRVQHDSWGRGRTRQDRGHPEPPNTGREQLKPVRRDLSTGQWGQQRVYGLGTGCRHEKRTAMQGRWPPEPTPSSSSMMSFPMEASVVHLQLLVARTAHRL